MSYSLPRPSETSLASAPRVPGRISSPLARSIRQAWKSEPEGRDAHPGVPLCTGSVLCIRHPKCTTYLTSPPRSKLATLMSPSTQLRIPSRCCCGVCFLRPGNGIDPVGGACIQIQQTSSTWVRPPSRSSKPPHRNDMKIRCIARFIVPARLLLISR